MQQHPSSAKATNPPLNEQQSNEITSYNSADYDQSQQRDQPQPRSSNSTPKETGKSSASGRRSRIDWNNNEYSTATLTISTNTPSTTQDISIEGKPSNSKPVSGSSLGKGSFGNGDQAHNGRPRSGNPSRPNSGSFGQVSPASRPALAAMNSTTGTFWGDAATTRLIFEPIVL